MTYTIRISESTLIILVSLILTIERMPIYLPSTKAHYGILSSMVTCLLLWASTTNNGKYGRLMEYFRSYRPMLRTIRDERKQNFSRTSLRRILKLAQEQKYSFYSGCIVLLLRLPLSLSIPHFVSSTLGALARDDFSTAKHSILSLVLYGTMDACLDYWFVVQFGITNLRIVKALRLETFDTILKQDVAYFDCSNSGELVSRINSDSQSLGSDLTWFLRTIIESIVRILGITVYMYSQSPTLATYAVSILPIVSLVNKLYGDWLRHNAVAVQEANADVAAVSIEILSSIKTVIGFSSEDIEKSRYKRFIEKLYSVSLSQLYTQGWYCMIMNSFTINTCVQSFLLWLGMVAIKNKKTTVDVLISFMMYHGQFQHEVLNLFSAYRLLMSSVGAGEKLFTLFDRRTPAPGFGSPDVMQGPFSPPDLWDINLRKVGFKYPTRKDHTVLYDLNLDIPKGRTMALVGKSGCGKSTIFALLQRFYDPDSGAIFIDGKDLRGIPLSGYRRRIGIVQQDPVLFMGSIRENIAYGYKEATNEEVEDAARLANAHDFIQSFPEKYETQVGERGVQLSGGQKQRIAIARAVIRRPSLLLLDEATSALDSESEKIVQLALDDLLSRKGDMTVLVIAHRLQTVRNADCIAVIDRGRVVEKGSHTELMKVSEGIYRRMVERASQSGALAE